MEAALAFPIFFFCVLYLLQMFLVLQAELAVAQTGLTTVREVAEVSYAANRLRKGEDAVADKLLSVFDYKLIRDMSVAAVFYERCDRELLLRAGVGRGLGGMWTDTKKEGERTELHVYFRVAPPNALFPEGRGYYRISLVGRSWTGVGELKREKKEGETKEEMAYLAENASVYHLYADCRYINIKAEGVAAEQISKQRNASGAKYYACEFCKPVATLEAYVYITKYGTRYHALSSCSAIERTPRQEPLEEAKGKYRLCKTCEQRTEKEKKP